MQSIALLVALPALFAQLTPAGPLHLDGDLRHPDQLSGGAIVGDFFLLAPDEGAELNVLKKTAANRYKALDHPIKLLDDADSEVDMEGVAADGQFVYMIGSHCVARKEVEGGHDYEENLERIATVKDESSRDTLFRFKLSDEGKAKSLKQISLQEVIENDEILKRFRKIPGKENGIDIEGVAVGKDKRLYIGFRGPVLRGGYVPVMALQFDDPTDYELRYVDLGGRGIRDIVRLKDDFLILAGPVADSGEFAIYRWNGLDCIPGDGGPGGETKKLCEVEAKDGMKPEGIVVVERDEEQATLLIICDAAKSEPVRKYKLRLQ